MDKTVHYPITDLQALREKLVSVMGICTQPEMPLRQYFYDVINRDSRQMTGSITLAVEGDRIVLKYKPTHFDTEAEPVDLKVGVSDFEAMHMFLANIGMHVRTFQEVKREEWEIDGKR